MMKITFSHLITKVSILVLLDRDKELEQFDITADSSTVSILVLLDRDKEQSLSDSDLIGISGFNPCFIG